MSLSSVDDLQKRMRDTGDEYTSVDFESKLREADNRLNTLVGRKFVERKVIQFEDENVVDLDFGKLESFDKVVNVNGEGNEIVDSSDYAESLADGTVDFDQSYVDDSFFEGLVLDFYYVPSIFKDLELDIAQRNIQEGQTVQTTDGVNNTQTDRLNTRIQSKIRNINSRASSGVMHGDNKNRGSQRPRRFGGE